MAETVYRVLTVRTPEAPLPRGSQVETSSILVHDAARGRGGHPASAAVPYLPALRRGPTPDGAETASEGYNDCPRTVPSKVADPAPLPQANNASAHGIAIDLPIIDCC